jgi:hypothetical protein
MDEVSVPDLAVIASRLRKQAETDAMRITLHGHQEMVQGDISLDEIREVLLDATVVENYPEHKRGPCCLVCGWTSRGRPVHVVCTTSLEIAIITTVYEPKPPKWVTPSERGRAE